MQTTRQVKIGIYLPFYLRSGRFLVFLRLFTSKQQLAQFRNLRMAIDIPAFLTVFAATGNRTENPCVAGSIPAPATTVLNP